MAIDRTPFNALVDDVGDGVSGTIWNKTAIKNVVLDPVDAAEFGARVAVPFNAANFLGSAGMTWTVTAAQMVLNEYVIAGKLAVWTLYVYLSTIGGTPSGNLVVTLPAGIVIGNVNMFWYPSWVAEGGGSPVTGALLTGQDSTHLRLYKTAGTNWPVGNNVVAFTIPIPLV